MQINLNKLENVREITKNGESAHIARCPACAEAGNDNTGNHLIIFASGKFGCVVHEGDTDHRRRVLQLVGADNDPRPLRRSRFIPKIKPLRIERQVHEFPTIVNSKQK